MKNALVDSTFHASKSDALSTDKAVEMLWTGRGWGGKKRKKVATVRGGEGLGHGREQPTTGGSCVPCMSVSFSCAMGTASTRLSRACFSSSSFFFFCSSTFVGRESEDTKGRRKIREMNEKEGVGVCTREVKRLE
jgi:hypothetical protein